MIAFRWTLDRVPFVVLNAPPSYVTPVGLTDTRAHTPFRYGEIGRPYEYEMLRFLSHKQEALLTAE